MKESEIRPKELFKQYLDLAKEDALSFEKSLFEFTNCTSCDSTSTKSKMVKDDFNYDICDNCGTVFCNPRPSLLKLNEFYKNSISAKFWFETFLPEVEESRREKIFRKKAIELITLIRDIEIDVNNLCDIGAGSGIFIEELRRIRQDISYSAIEPGAISSQILKNKKIPVLNESVENAQDWKEKFDFVVSLEVLEHVNQPIDFVKAAYNLLKTDGYCLITTLGYEGFDILTLGVNSNSISPPHHLNFPSLEGFKTLFDRAGFRDVQVMTPGVLDVDIVLNSDESSEFLRIMKNRGDHVVKDFQEFLIRHKLSSHVWILAKK